MYELFEKLRDFETETSQNYSDWDSLEKALDKKGGKRSLWIKLSVAFLVLLIPIELGELAAYSYIQKDSVHVSEKSDQVTVPNSNDLLVEAQSKLYTAAMPNYLTPSNLQLASSDVSNKVLIQQTDIANNSISEKQEKNNDLQKLITNSETTILKINENDQQTILASEVLEEESSRVEENGNSEELNLDPTPLNLENQSNTFDLEIGVKTSFLNGISNTSETPNSWGIGAFVNLRYNIGKSFAIGCDVGITSEFNHNLSYSYLSESRTFLQRSDKFLNINTKKVYATNLLLSASYKWNEKFITGGGVYYNFVLQTVSEVHEFGTGSFSDLGSQIIKKRGYSDLFNRNEFGLYLSQTYRPNDSWGITLGFRKGLTNRVNTSYFPDYQNKRTELSLMISKRIL